MELKGAKRYAEDVVMELEEHQAYRVTDVCDIASRYDYIQVRKLMKAYSCSILAIWINGRRRLAVETMDGATWHCVRSVMLRPD